MLLGRKKKTVYRYVQKQRKTKKRRIRREEKKGSKLRKDKERDKYNYNNK